MYAKGSRRCRRRRLLCRTTWVGLQADQLGSQAVAPYHSEDCLRLFEVTASFCPVQDAQDHDLLVFLIHGIDNHERSARNREFPEAVSMIPWSNATEIRILPKSIDCGNNAGGDPEG